MKNPVGSRMNSQADPVGHALIGGPAPLSSAQKAGGLRGLENSRKNGHPKTRHRADAFLKKFSWQ